MLAVWDSRRPKGRLRQTRSISSSRRATLFILAQPLPALNHLVDKTQHHPSVTTLEAGAFVGSVAPTALASANAWIYPHSSNFAEPANHFMSPLRTTQSEPACNLLILPWIEAHQGVLTLLDHRFDPTYRAQMLRTRLHTLLRL